MENNNKGEFQQDKKFWELIINNLPGIFYLYTYPEKRLVLWNKQHEIILGYTHEELQNRLVTDWFLPEHREIVLNAIEIVMEKGNNSIEGLLVAKDGRQIPFALNGAKFESEGQLYFLGIGIDITERKKIENNAKANEALLKEAQLAASIGSYCLDVKTGMWDSSEELDFLFGIDGSYDRSVEGWVKLVHPEDQKMMDSYFRNEVLVQGKSFNKVYRIVRHNDKIERWVHGLGELKKESMGRPVEMRGTIQDITENKIIEEKFKEKYAEMEKMYKLTTDRELKMVELKKEIEDLKAKNQTN